MTVELITNIGCLYNNETLINLISDICEGICIFTTFAKQSMINRLSNAINRNRSAAKISKVMSSSPDLILTLCLNFFFLLLTKLVYIVFNGDMLVCLNI